MCPTDFPIFAFPFGRCRIDVRHLAYGSGEKTSLPFSIPARSVLITSKPSRLFTGGCHIEANSTEVAFIAEPRDGKRLRNIISLNNVRQAVRRNGVILLRMRLPGMAPIREDAFESEEQLQAFLKLVQDAVDSRLNGGSSVTQA